MSPNQHPAFPGFSAGKTRLVPIPAVFFASLLPAIDHLEEMKVTLYAFWFLDRQEGNFRFIRYTDFSTDAAFMSGLGQTPEIAQAALDDGLERAEQRGTLLKATVKYPDRSEPLYFLNTARGRAAVQALANGDWQPDFENRPPLALNLERPNIFRLYEEHIGPLTPMIAESLRDAEAAYPAEWIEEALRIAMENNVRRWRYVEAILRSWQEEGRDDAKFDETLRKMAADISKENTPNSSNTEESPAQKTMAGDPNCPICGGIGYLHQDLPITHPDFGKVIVCTCRQAEVSRLVHQRLFLLSNLDALQRLTFETFQSRGRVGLGEQQASSIERAYNQSQQFSGTLNGWLLLMGDYGSGKTHLAAAIANRAVELGVSTLFITVPDLLDWLRFSYGSSETSYEERFDEIRNSALLIMDDFGTQNATAWAQEKLFQILNFRYINHLATVITTNQSLEEIEPRLRSRIQDPELVTVCKINAPDFRNPADDTGHHELSSLGLHSKQSFSNFNLRHDEGLPGDKLQTLERAFQAAQSFAEHPLGWLVLMGEYGSGKTHLAAAIGNYRAGLGYPPLLVVVPDLLDHLRATFSPNSATSYDKRFYEVRSTPFLILDDLSTQSATPWAKEKLYQILNHRYNAELPTVITTADKLDNLDERLRTRMLDSRVCRVLAITVPFYRGAERGSEDKKSQNSRRRGS